MKTVTREWVEMELVKGRKCFENLDMEHSYLEKLDFTGCTFSNVNLRESNFTDAKLDYCWFNGCDISYCNFRDASLKSAIFEKCTANEVAFNGANMSNVMMSDMIMYQPTFMDTILSDAHMRNVQMIDVHMEDVALMRATIESCLITAGVYKISNCDLSKARILFTTFSNADIWNSTMKDTELLYCKFSVSNIIGTNLAGLVAIHTDLRNLDPTNGGNFEVAVDLRNSVLIASNIRDANLQNADMRNTKMISNAIIGAWFGGVDLTGADISKQNFFDDSFDETTKGIKHSFTGGIVEMIEEKE